MPQVSPEAQDLITKVGVILVGSGALAGIIRLLLSKFLEILGRIPEKEWFDRVERRLDDIPSKHWFDAASKQLENIPSKSTLDAVLTSFVANNAALSALEAKSMAQDSRITDAHVRINDNRNRIHSLENRVTSIETRQNPDAYNEIKGDGSQNPTRS